MLALVQECSKEHWDILLNMWMINMKMEREVPSLDS